MFRDRRRQADHDPFTKNGHEIAVDDDGVAFIADFLPDGIRVCRPEISLVAAIFEDAVRCVQRTSRSVTHSQSSEAFEWIASERRDWPFAFVNVCDLLGVDATVVRKRLRIGDESSGDSPSAREIEIAAGNPAM